MKIICIEALPNNWTAIYEIVVFSILISILENEDKNQHRKLKIDKT